MLKTDDARSWPDCEGRTPLFYAALRGEVAEAETLIATGAEVNVQDRNGESPLHFAAREYRVSLAALLLRSGATVDIQDANGNTPLLRAVFSSRGRGEIITLLLAHGAKKDLKNQHGVSPEDLAKTIANYGVESLLMDPRK